MNDVIKVSLAGLNIGPVGLVNLDAMPVAAKSPLHNPLLLTQQDGKTAIRYRHGQSVMPRDGAYETELGMVLAATAVVFNTPVAATPSQMSVLLLVRADASPTAANDGLRLLLAQPARDGNYDAARPADAAQQQALATSAKPIEMTPTQEGVADMLAIIRAALLADAQADIALPIAAEDIRDIAFNLPTELSFEEDGLFYFRNAMSGEADFLFTGQGNFRDAEVQLTLTGGRFHLLDDEADYYEQGGEDPAEGVTYLTARVKDVEGLLSRIVIIVDEDAEYASVDITVLSNGQILAETSLSIVPAEENLSTHFVDIDDTVGLPDDADAQDEDVLITSDILPLHEPAVETDHDIDIGGIYVAPDVL